MSTPSIQTLITQAQQVLNLKSTNEIRATLAAVLANANVGTPLNPNLTTQQLWDEFYEIVRQPSDDIMSIVVDQMMRMVFSPPAPGGAGADKQVIFNDMGVLAGDAGLVYNKTTDALTVAGLVTAGSAAITGAATVGTTLGVTGASTLTGSVGIGAVASAKLSVTDTNGIPIRFGDITAAPVSQTACFVGVSTSNLPGSSNGDLILVPRTSDARDVVIYTGSGTAADRLRVTAAGNVNITTGNVVMATSGKGIDFSAKTPDGSGTVGSEVLNDYEEGTFTPTAGDASSGGNQATTASAVGRYTKIGRLVTVHFELTDINTTGLTAGNSMNVRGLPFAASSATTQFGTIAGAGITFTGFLTCGVFNGSAFPIYATSTGGALADIKVSGFASGTADIFGTLTYFV